MMKDFFRFIKFWFICHRLLWLAVEFETKTKFKPTKLYLRDDVFDFIHVCIVKYDFSGLKDMHDLFGVNHLNRDNGIKFARYE